MFLDVLRFLGVFFPIKINKKKIKHVVETCSFDILKKREKNEGFFEAPVLEGSNKKAIFFNLGKKNNWKKILDPTLEEKIRLKFSAEMNELGYL